MATQGRNLLAEHQQFLVAQPVKEQAQGKEKAQGRNLLAEFQQQQVIKQAATQQALQPEAQQQVQQVVQPIQQEQQVIQPQVEQVVAQPLEQPEQAIQPEAPKGRDLLAEFNQNRPVAELPEIQAIEKELGIFSPENMQLQTGLLLSFDPEEQKDIIKSALPEANFSQRHGADVIEYQGKEFVLNQEGLSAQDVQTGVAQFLSFFPSAKLAGLGKNLLQRVGIGAVGAGATSAGLDVAAGGLGSEQGVSAEDAAIAAGLGAVGELAAPFLGKIVGAVGKPLAAVKESVKGAIKAPAGSKTAAAMEGLTRPETRLAREATSGGKEAFDVSQDIGKALESESIVGARLLPAQRTAGQKELATQEFLGSLPKFASKANTELKRLNKSASEGVNEFISKIAPPESVITAGKKVLDASKMAIEFKNLARQQNTTPAFNAAFNKAPAVTTDRTLDLIKSYKGVFKSDSPVFKKLSKFEKKINDAGGSLENLHNTKNLLDLDSINNVSNFGKNIMATQEQRAILQVKDSLLQELMKQSPKYKKAAEEFSSLNPSIKEFTEGVVGQIADLTSADSVAIASKIFSKTANPETIRKAKDAISVVDPVAWNQILRVEVEKRLSTSKALLDAVEGGNISNVPAQLNKAIFGNAKQTETLMAGLDANMKRNALALKDWMGRASLGRPGGAKELDKLQNKGVFKEIALWVTGLKPLAATANFTKKQIAELNNKALANVFFDPRFKIDLNKIVNKSPSNAATGKALLQLLNDSAKSIIEEDK